MQNEGFGRYGPILRIGGLPIGRLTRKQWVAHFLNDLDANRARDQAPAFMTSANGNILSMAARDSSLLNSLLEADGIDADGMSLVLASRLLCREPLPERVATTDFFHDLAELSEAHDLRFYFLGATEVECLKAMSEVQRRYPRLQVRGHHGYFSEDEESEVIEDILAAQADVLWVSLGVPREQNFVIRNRHRLTGVTWIKTSGGLLNFLSGTNSRAPRILQEAGLEWLYRLALEPRRLFRRYAVTNAHALYLMLTRTSAATEIPFAVERSHRTEGGKNGGKV
jgi:N-acetylglucosaminyldiphosphoundecaprenol N-acetyl-beta-D-mannosaminyltransferase